MEGLARVSTFFLLIRRPPPIHTRFPYTTLFRSHDECRAPTCLGGRAHPACAMPIKNGCVSATSYFCLHPAVRELPNRPARTSLQRLRTRSRGFADRWRGRDRTEFVSSW